MHCSTYQVTFLLVPTVQTVPLCGSRTGGLKMSRGFRVADIATDAKAERTATTENFMIVRFGFVRVTVVKTFLERLVWLTHRRHGES